MPLGLGEQKSRRSGGGRPPPSPCLGKRVRAHARPLAVAVALAVSLWLSGSPAASAAGGSAPPKPQVLWHAYPLSPPQGRTGTAGRAKTGAAHTRPASPPANGPDAAPPAARTFPALPLAAAAALGVAIIAAIVPLRRRRAARQGDAIAPPARGSTGRGRLLHTLAQEDGTLAPARRGVQRDDAKAADRSSGALAAGSVTESLLESIELVSQARVLQAERVEHQLTPAHGRDWPSAQEKEVLRRTSETADAEAAAKLKSSVQASAALKHATRRDLTVLKAKLSEPHTKPSRTSVQLQRAQSGNRTPGPVDHAPARSMPDKGETETNAPGRAATPSHCHIDWRADDDGSRFWAIALMPSGAESILHSSPPLEWKGDAPPSKDLPQAGSAYRALVSRLVEEGWMATGIRERWYELELERTPEHAHDM